MERSTKLFTVMLVLLAPIVLSAQEPVRFGRDVLPILSANCFTCHGPDDKNRQAGLRLDLEESAKAKRRSGFPVIPGEPEKSLIIRRLTSADPDMVMPPPGTHRNVRPDQIEILRRWIAEGAKWGKHWSFEPVARPITPTGQHPIDALVSAALAKKGLKLRPPAAPQTLVRRLWLDLIGLPPTPEIADKFAADPSPRAYERMVDDLLQKPQFGEHWARMWLDLARYADTRGYEKDLGRTMWPYRDWVVNAFNEDMPLDRFTTEQLAGDLLPNPTEQQLIATAFHRNTMTNDEGGTDDEEFRVAAVKDRVDTTAQVWMGLTMGCAKCHTHKYDPISQADYYSFYAIFNQTADADRSDDSPTMEALSPWEKEERARLQTRVQAIERELGPLEESFKTEAPGNDKWRVATVVEAVSQNGATLSAQKDGAVGVGGKTPPEDTYTLTLSLSAGAYRSLRLEALPEKLPDGQLAVGRDRRADNFILSELTAELLDGSGARPLRLTGARADFAEEKGPVAAVIDGDVKTGWSVSSRAHEPHFALFDFAEPLQLNTEARLRIKISQLAGDSTTLRRFRLAMSQADPATLQPPSVSPELRRRRDELSLAYKDLKKFNDNVARLPVMRELPEDKKRVTKIQIRGNFLDQGDLVTPGVPAAILKFPDGAPLNRLGVAQWLVNRDNPLTPRVWANRVWARLFGAGIVETEEDFGMQGSPPTNPELLDWLAAEYRDGGWSLKKFIKTIVMSGAYRQVSDITPALREAD
ncbi:MAG: PSD1 domain-containing protein, partial [Chloracidobacterium sp.]|nr:PSD1 domain-containing protein [Chloracidobacterium sp.]